MTRRSSKESTARLFQRYVWLVDTIYRAGRITFEGINGKWMNSGLNPSGEDFPLKTFHNHKTAIRDMFDIDIECDRRSGYTYYIGNSDDMEPSGARSWLLDTFAVNNLIHESHQLKHRILLEKIPGGQRFLAPIIEAMRDSTAIEMAYQNYWHDEPCAFEVLPYCVKAFRQRWYVVAYSDYYDGIRIYSLDRIRSLRATDNRFAMPEDFDGEGFFANSFGISNCGKAEFVNVKVLRAGKKDAYFKSLPLHHSQEIVEQAERYTVFRYYIQPTYDFRQELLAHGAEIEVLSPAWFRDEISGIIEEMGMIYRKE